MENIGVVLVTTVAIALLIWSFIWLRRPWTGWMVANPSLRKAAEYLDRNGYSQLCEELLLHSKASQNALTKNGGLSDAWMSGQTFLSSDLWEKVASELRKGGEGNYGQWKFFSNRSKKKLS